VKSPQPLHLALEIGDFAAQAIAAWDPPKRGRPFVVVDQDPDDHKTYVIACSRAARELGESDEPELEAGMSMMAVRRLSRRLRIPIEPVFRNFAWEAALCEELRALCCRYTPEFDVRAGKALLDMTGTPAARALQPEALGGKLRRDVLYAAGLEDAAVGVAATRLMAKVMARLALERGDAVRICPAGREAEILAPLEPGCLPGLSPQCRERIRRYALASVGQIRALGRRDLAVRFGGEGDKLYTLSCGLDMRQAPAPRQGIFAETVLESDVNDGDALARKVRLTVDKLVFQLRALDRTAEKLVVALRYADNKAVRKTVRVRPGTSAFQPLAALAQEAFHALYVRRVALRSISLSSPPAGSESGQGDLFDSILETKQRALGDAMAKIRGRSGFGSILSGANVGG
jgi:DNA polymerase-4